MPRRPRINTPMIPQHIVQRGINREPCFYAEEDYHCYLHWLQKSAADWHCAIHACVLMINHVHLLLTPHKPDSAARLMKYLAHSYLISHRNDEARREFTTALKLDPQLYRARYNLLRLDDENEERGRTFRR